MTPQNRILGGEGDQKLRQKIGYHLWMFPIDVTKLVNY